MLHQGAQGVAHSIELPSFLPSTSQERKDFRKVAEDLSWVFRQSSSRPAEDLRGAVSSAPSQPHLTSTCRQGDTESEQKEEGQRKRWVDAVFERPACKRPRTSPVVTGVTAAPKPSRISTPESHASASAAYSASGML